MEHIFVHPRSVVGYPEFTTYRQMVCVLFIYYRCTICYVGTVEGESDHLIVLKGWICVLVFRAQSTQYHYSRYRIIWPHILLAFIERVKRDDRVLTAS
jgi:hypothetical protein